MRKGLKVLLIILLLIGIGIGSYFAYKKYQEKKELERVKNAIINIEFIDPLEIDFNSNYKLSDLIKKINGQLIEDFKINTTVVGEHTIKFKYTNEEEIIVPYEFKIKIVDKKPPIVNLGSTYNVTVGYNKKLEDVILCADDVDDNPDCKIVGEYDFNTVGNYSLKYIASDKSGNKTSKDFLLKVNPKSSGGGGSSSSSSIPFGSLYNEYKKDNTKIGIDVSKWQGDIDFDKVKEAGVEFVFIKIGGQNGIGKDYYLDPKFERNYEGFKRVGIPIGLYFYSYADSMMEARHEALWIIDKIKDKKIDLPIAYDWENWSSFNKFNISFNTLTNSANVFIKTLEKYGYQGMLYSSKYYLENMWLKNNNTIWLAHYTSKTDYKGKYACWQRTSSAKIPGITVNTVDFDICYEE